MACLDLPAGTGRPYCLLVINSNNGIGYGGVDKYGDQEPSVKEFLWDDAPE